MGEKREIRTLGEYQRLMDRFESAGDAMLLPEIHVVIRVDAHRIGPEWHDFPEEHYPFGAEFVEAIIGAARHLMCSGFKTTAAFVHGDEISLLLDPAELANPRRKSRLLSYLASAATVGFLREFGRAAIFHAKLSELPTREHVLDYFMWQRKVAQRNFYSRVIGLALAAQGEGPKEIDARLSRLSEEERTQLASTLGRPPAAISPYERFGALLWWEEGRGPQATFQLAQSLTLPAADEEYLSFLLKTLTGSALLVHDGFFGIERALQAPPPTKPVASSDSRAKFRLGPKFGPPRPSGRR